MEAENKLLTENFGELKECPKCKGYMHWCHEDRVAGIWGAADKLAKGCAAKKVRHPEENCWICLFCDIVVPC